MALEIRPEVMTLDDGSKYWEQKYDSFYLKTYVPANNLDGQVNNYGFKAPLGRIRLLTMNTMVRSLLIYPISRILSTTLLE